MPDFWIDSDALIRTKSEGWDLDEVPEFWEFLLSLARKGTIASPALVDTELTEDKNDALADWVRANRDVLFREASQEVQEKYNEIADYVNANYDEPHAKEFLKGADGWLIAHAYVEGGQIVTWERRVGAMQRNSKVKIPDVADQFNVKCVKIWEMTKAVGMKVSVGG